jgi:hypothetical protein
MAIQAKAASCHLADKEAVTSESKPNQRAAARSSAPDTISNVTRQGRRATVAFILSCRFAEDIRNQPPMGLGVLVTVGVLVGVGVGVLVEMSVLVGVGVIVLVTVGVNVVVGVMVGVDVGVLVATGVEVIVGVLVRVAVAVGVRVIVGV